MSQTLLPRFQWGLVFSPICLSFGISLHIGMRSPRVPLWPLPYHMRSQAVPIPQTFLRLHLREDPFRC